MATITSTEAGATGRYIDLSTSPANNVDVGAQTIIVYCNPTASGGAGFAYHIGKTTAGSTAGLRFFITHNGGSPGLTFGVSSSGGAGFPQKSGTAGEVTYGSWQHHIADWDGTLNHSGIHMYIGATESTYAANIGSTSNNGSGSINSDAAKRLFLLNRGDSGNLGREFVGDNGYIARWNRVLNSTERANVIANGPLSEPSGLILCWANDQDYSTNAITAAGRSTRVTGGTPTNTALGGTGTTVAPSTGHLVYTGYVPTVSQGGATSVAPSTGHLVYSGYVPTVVQMGIEGAYERASVVLASSSIVGLGDSAIVSISPKLQESEVTDTRWLEPSAEVTGVNGYRPTFRFLNYKSGSGGMHGYSAWWPTSRRPMYAYPPYDTWNYFDTAVTLDTTNQWIEFRNSTAFTGNTVRIGRSRQITVHQVGDWLASMGTTYSSFFGPSAAAIAYTPTGSVSGYAAQTYIADEFSTQTDSTGATVPVTPFYAAEINDTSLSPVGGHSKRLAVVTSGVHGGEDFGTYHMREFIAYLCGSSTEAQALRRNYRILIYPCMNPPGRAGGGWRGSWTQGTGGADDTNRHFSDTGSTLEIVDKPKAVITTDRASAVPDWMIDFHGTGNNEYAVFADPGDAYQDSFKTKLASYGGVTVADEGNSNTGFVSWYFHGLGAKLAVTHETGDGTPKSDASIVTHGTAIVNTLNAMLTEGAFGIAPATGHLTYTGYVPTVSQGSSIVPSTGHLVYTGYVPTVTQGAGTAVAPSTGHLVYTGYVPTVTNGGAHTVAPATGHLVYTGYAPTVVQGGSQSIAPSTGHLTYTGHVPQVSNAASTINPAASVVLRVNQRSRLWVVPNSQNTQ